MLVPRMSRKERSYGCHAARKAAMQARTAVRRTLADLAGRLRYRCCSAGDTARGFHALDNYTEALDV